MPLEECRIFVANLGYARDIDGSALRHVVRSLRHFYFSPRNQQVILNDCRTLIKECNPDLCCLLEVDTGSFTSGGFNQFTYLTMQEFPYRDVASKYTSPRRQKSLLTAGKSNGFMARHAFTFQRVYLSRGSKQLVYRIELTNRHTLFFTHLSLIYGVRVMQLKELRALADREEGEVIIAGDFNILAGLDELNILLGDGRYHLANDRSRATFRLFGRRYLLDLCIVSASLADTVRVDVIDQIYSDHDALLIHLKLGDDAQ